MVLIGAHAVAAETTVVATTITPGAARSSRNILGPPGSRFWTYCMDSRRVALDEEPTVVVDQGGQHTGRGSQRHDELTGEGSGRGERAGGSVDGL